MNGSPLDRPLIGPQIEPRAPALRARITNHKDLLPGLDGRTGAARRFRDLVSSYIADMGGIDRCSEIKLGASAPTRGGYCASGAPRGRRRYAVHTRLHHGPLIMTCVVVPTLG